MKLKLSGEYGLIEALTLLVERLCASAQGRAARPSVQTRNLNDCV